MWVAVVLPVIHSRRVISSVRSPAIDSASASRSRLVSSPPDDEPRSVGTSGRLGRLSNLRRPSQDGVELQRPGEVIVGAEQ